MMNTTIDYDSYYQILELPPGASLKEIKRNYRQLVRRWHPDQVPESEKLEATEKMKEVNEAREILESYWEINGCPPPSVEQQRQEAWRQQQEAEAQRVHEERLRQEETQKRQQQKQRRQEEEARRVYEEQLRQAQEQHQRQEAQRRAQEQEERRQQAAALLSPFERKTIVAILLAAEGALFSLWFGVLAMLNSFSAYLNSLHVDRLADLLFNLSALAVYVVLVITTVVGGIGSVIFALILAWTLIADAIRGSAHAHTTVRIVTLLRSVVSGGAGM